MSTIDKKDRKISDGEVDTGSYVADPKNVEAGRTGVIEHDAVFGEITEEGPNYRNIGWMSTAIIMFKSNVGLGVLSLPSILATLGMGPGLICIAVIGAMTTWGAYMIGVIKRKYPQVYCIDDMGYLIGGPIGREILAIASWLFMVFVAGAGMVGIATALNAISVHGACTAIFVAVACIATILVSSIQTLGRIKFFGWVGVVSIMAAIITLVIAVGVQERPSEAPQEGPWNKIIVNWGQPEFSKASAAISGIVLAYAGAPTYFPMVSEMKNPNHFTRAVLCSQLFVIVLYLVLGGIVYHYVGQYVASPALGSAGPLLKRICYGLALPALLVSTVLYTHFSAKYIFVRSLRGSPHLSRNTVRHWIVWLGCVFGCAIFAYVIASAIPAFGSLVSLIGAALGTLVCLQPFGAFWLWDNWKRPEKRLTWYLMAVWCGFIIVVGFFLMGAGTYGSVVEIIDVYKQTGGSAWTCADNSNSVKA